MDGIRSEPSDSAPQVSQNLTESRTIPARPACGKTIPVEIKQATPPARAKKIRHISLWVSETEYYQLCEALTDEATVSSFVRGALKNALKARTRKRKT